MTSQGKPDLPELQELAPLIAAGDWATVDKLLDEDYALKVEREKIYTGVLESEHRQKSLSEALLAAVDADRPETVGRILRLEDYGFVQFIMARNKAAAQTNMKILRIMDRFVAQGPELLQQAFTDILAPITDTRVQADRISRIKRRTPGQKKGMKP